MSKNIFKLFNCRLQNTENLSKQFTLLFKKIWCHEDTVPQEVSNEIEQIIDGQLLANILLTKSKITYLKVLYVYMYV